jgi:hypothetical protein
MLQCHRPKVRFNANLILHSLMLCAEHTAAVASRFRMVGALNL